MSSLSDSGNALHEIFLFLLENRRVPSSVWHFPRFARSSHLMDSEFPDFLTKVWPTTLAISKNRRIPNHEPELFHAVFSNPKKKNKFHIWNQKKTGFPPPNRITEIRNSISRSQAPPLVANFWKSPWKPTKSQVSPFPQIVHIPFCQSCSFFGNLGWLWVWVFFQNLWFQVAGGTPNRKHSHEHHLMVQQSPVK